MDDLILVKIDQLSNKSKQLIVDYIDENNNNALIIQPQMGSIIDLNKCDKKTKEYILEIIKKDKDTSK